MSRSEDMARAYCERDKIGPHWSGAFANFAREYAREQLLEARDRLKPGRMDGHIYDGLKAACEVLAEMAKDEEPSDGK